MLDFHIHTSKVKEKNASCLLQLCSSDRAAMIISQGLLRELAKYCFFVTDYRVSLIKQVSERKTVKIRS